MHPVALGVTGLRRNGYSYGYTDRHNKIGPLSPVPPKISPQGVRGEASVYYKFLLGLFLRAEVGIKVWGDPKNRALLRTEESGDMGRLPSPTVGFIYQIILEFWVRRIKPSTFEGASVSGTWW